MSNTVIPLFVFKFIYKKALIFAYRKLMKALVAQVKQSFVKQRVKTGQNKIKDIQHLLYYQKNFE